MQEPCFFLEQLRGSSIKIYINFSGLIMNIQSCIIVKMATLF